MKRIFVLFISSMFAVCCFCQVRTIEQAKEEMKGKLIEMCKVINQQTPIRVDEDLTLNSIMFTDWQLISSYCFSVSIDGLSSENIKELRDVAKKMLIENIKTIYVNGGDWGFTMEQFKSMLKDCNLRFLYGFYDINGKLMFNLRIDYNDF